MRRGNAPPRGVVLHGIHAEKLLALVLHATVEQYQCYVVARRWTVGDGGDAPRLWPSTLSPGRNRIEPSRMRF